MDGKAILKTNQEQAVASWINYLNQIRLKRLRDRKDELQARLKEVQARIDETEAQLVEMMTTEECTGFDRSGFRFSLVIREYPGAIPEEKEELYAQMRSHGFEHLLLI